VQKKYKIGNLKIFSIFYVEITLNKGGHIEKISQVIMFIFCHFIMSDSSRFSTGVSENRTVGYSFMYMRGDKS